MPTRSTETQDVDRSLRGEGQCLAYSAKHNYNTGRTLRSQLQMADRGSVKGEKGDFSDIRGGPESLRLRVSNRPPRN
jgi:hypothetical protein